MVTHDQRFAACYLAGLLVGGLCAHVLPWWMSGSPGWTLLIATVLVSAWRRPVDTMPTRCVGFGLFFGAMSGAAAVDFAEVADAITWPGHDSASAMSAAVGVALASAIGLFAGPRCQSRYRPCNTSNPATFGLLLYITTVVIGYAPLLAEVMQ